MSSNPFDINELAFEPQDEEILSINRGFLALYQHRELPYDETFYDLSLALNAVPLRKEKLKEILPILAFLRDLLGGKNGKAHEVLVTQENDQFYFNLPEGRFETHLVAEGYRKIATFTAKSDGLYPDKRV